MFCTFCFAPQGHPNHELSQTETKQDEGQLGEGHSVSCFLLPSAFKHLDIHHDHGFPKEESDEYSTLPRNTDSLDFAERKTVTVATYPLFDILVHTITVIWECPLWCSQHKKNLPVSLFIPADLKNESF